MRFAASGKGPGFPILLLGGDHGDLPLPALGGAAVARLVVEQGVDVIADTSGLMVGERTRWFIDFASTLYRLNRAPLHLVIERDEKWQSNFAESIEAFMEKFDSEFQKLCDLNGGPPANKSPRPESAPAEDDNPDLTP